MQNSLSVGSGRAVSISSNKFPGEVDGPGTMLRTVGAGAASAASVTTPPPSGALVGSSLLVMFSYQRQLMTRYRCDYFQVPQPSPALFAHAFQVRLGEFVPLLTALKAPFPLATASLTMPTLWVERCFSGGATASSGSAKRSAGPRQVTKVWRSRSVFWRHPMTWASL